MFAPNKWLCNWWDWRCFQSHAHHHRTCQHVNMSSKCHALCQAVLVPNNVRPQQNVQVSHLLMNLTWQSIRQQVLCNDNDMTWQSISAAVQWQWHDMTIYQTWNDNDNWKCCSGWDWRCFQPGQPRSIMKRTCMPWTRSMKMRCIAMNAMNLHTTFLHAMNAVHERDMYAMNAINLHTTCCSCHECGPWTWRVCHECHESALNFFLSHRLLSSCFSPLMLSFCMHHATISSPSTVLCHARIQVTHMAVAAVVNGKVGTAWVNHMDNTSKPGIS